MYFYLSLLFIFRFYVYMYLFLVTFCLIHLGRYYVLSLQHPKLDW